MRGGIRHVVPLLFADPATLAILALWALAILALWALARAVPAPTLADSQPLEVPPSASPA